MVATNGLATARGLAAISPLLLVLGLALFVFTGCVESRARHTPVPATPTQTTVPIPTPSPTPVPPTPTSVPTATPVVPTPTPTPTPLVIAVVDATAVPTPFSGTFNLALDFEGIGDESIVRSETVLLRGLTSADAIVSVNDLIVEVQTDGTFELTLILDPGPNFVDVVASNLDGSTINSSLAIISIPPEETT